VAREGKARLIKASRGWEREAVARQGKTWLVKAWLGKARRV
jgi:hypothetical protein